MNEHNTIHHLQYNPTQVFQEAILIWVCKTGAEIWYRNFVIHSSCKKIMPLAVSFLNALTSFVCASGGGGGGG